MQSEEPTIIQSLENHLAEYGHTTVGQDIAAAILVIKDLHQKAALSAQVQDVAGWQDEDKLTPDEAWTILCETPDITSPDEQLRSYMERANPAPEGWQLVPKEPTPEMISAARFYATDKWTRQGHGLDLAELYRDMLAAAPAKQEGGRNEAN
jgi:hypothetical protein